MEKEARRKGGAAMKKGKLGPRQRHDEIRKITLALVNWFEGQEVLLADAIVACFYLQHKLIDVGNFSKAEAADILGAIRDLFNER
jgi:hypothetical protein